MNKYDTAHFSQIAVSTKRVQNTYDAMTTKITALVSKINDPQFNFAKYGVINKMVDRYIADGTNALFYNIDGGVRNSWTIANTKNDAMFKEITGVKIDKFTQNAIEEKSQANLRLFQKASVGGMTTKERIFREQAAFKNQIETAINKVKASGIDANLGQEVKKLLDSGAISGSAAKNVNRLAVNEIQRAYRKSDWLRMQSNPFVIGFTVIPSRSFGVCSRCTYLAGTYPKDFYFTQWHTSCRCHCDPLIDTKKVNGTGITPTPEVPNNFKQWLAENEKKLKESKVAPEFVEKNDVLINPPLSDADYISLSKQFAGGFDQQSQALAQKMGCDATPVNIKSEKRIFEKASSDYNGDVTKCRDIVKNTFIVEADALEVTVKTLQVELDVLRIKVQVAEVDPLGYSGNLLNVKTSPKTFAEVQVNSPQMIFAKEKEADAVRLLGQDKYNKIKAKAGVDGGLGHTYYEEWRSLDELKYSARRRELEQLSKAYYEEIRKIKL